MYADWGKYILSGSTLAGVMSWCCPLVLCFSVLTLHWEPQSSTLTALRGWGRRMAYTHVLHPLRSHPHTFHPPYLLPYSSKWVEVAWISLILALQISRTTYPTNRQQLLKLGDPLQDDAPRLHLCVETKVQPMYVLWVMVSSLRAPSVQVKWLCWTSYRDLTPFWFFPHTFVANKFCLY